jgi:hypothetical protein
VVGDLAVLQMQIRRPEVATKIELTLNTVRERFAMELRGAQERAERATALADRLEGKQLAKYLANFAEKLFA